MLLTWLLLELLLPLYLNIGLLMFAAWVASITRVHMTDSSTGSILRMADLINTTVTYIWNPEGSLIFEKSLEGFLAYSGGGAEVSELYEIPGRFF